MTEGALDFARYAPQRPQLVTSQSDAIEAGELGLTVSIIRTALVLIRQSLWIATVIIGRRVRAWCEAKILHSLTSAWMLCSIGWGGFVGLALWFYFTRSLP